MFANACTTLLCLSVQRLFICLFVQHDSRCRQLSFFFINVQRLRGGEMSCLRMFLVAVAQVSSILEFHDLCDLGILDPWRFIEKVRPPLVYVGICEPIFTRWGWCLRLGI